MHGHLRPVSRRTEAATGGAAGGRGGWARLCPQQKVTQDPSWPWAAPPQSLPGPLRPCDTSAFTGLSPAHGAPDTACKSLDLHLKAKRHTGPTCVRCFPPLTWLCTCLQKGLPACQASLIHPVHCHLTCLPKTRSTVPLPSSGTCKGSAVPMQQPGTGGEAFWV